ncbi:hypothetical protein B0H11DRAFT_1751794 [Mycena galericulata]|nr:hypothetical protein B0H11DRAFT_1751794 [Mycena galericulata]
MPATRKSGVVSLRVKPSKIRISIKDGHRTSHKEITPTLATQRRSAANHYVNERYSRLSAEQKLVYDRLRDIPDPEESMSDFSSSDHDWEDDDDDRAHAEAVLQGRVEFETSHAGGEFHEMLEGRIRETISNKKKRAKDPRDRRDFLEKLVTGFKGQMEDITDAYMKWASTNGGLDKSWDGLTDGEVDSHFGIRIVDLFDSISVAAPMLKTDKWIASGLVRQGLMPCSPFAPTVAISIRCLELFRVAHLRAPNLTIQAWIKTLADIQGTVYKPYLSQQFSICFDVYLDILARVEKRVKKALGRDAPDWRLKNACPACTYKLEGEKELVFSIMTCMDGGNSLRRVLRKDGTEYDDDGNAIPSKSKERVDPRAEAAGGDYFLRREDVRFWSKEAIAARVKETLNNETSDDPVEKNLCEERWKNLSETITSKMWGIFDETGVFISLCRHGFMLVLADMVRSGELAEYPLAIVDALLEAYGPKIGNAYDINCGFETTVKNSPLGPKALKYDLKWLIGAFHGHAHNRLCQLHYLANYVHGMGLEDMEGCERWFSGANALARSTRYATVFHRKQAIRTYTAHHDTFEVYANLSSFLVNNYWQALDIIDTKPALYEAMAQEGIPDVSEFPRRLKAELDMLKSLKSEPAEETDKMDYYQKLVNLEARRCRLKEVTSAESTASKVVRRHAAENVDKALEAVQELETKLEIEVRWLPSSPEWDAAAMLVSTQRYRLAIDRLERLVIQRMFELTKMNLSQTGYKLRRHIAKALQARSQAIRTALKSYNAAAAALQPPGRSLKWDQVVEYAFLADFDLLRNEGEVTTIRAWATPAARLLLDSYFKIERAGEEINRCNVEITRVITYIRDERDFLIRIATELDSTDPTLAYFVREFQWKRGRFDEMHLERFKKLAEKAGSRFTGSLVPGRRLHAAVEVPAAPMEGVVETQRIREEAVSRGLVEEMSRLRINEEGNDDDVGERAEGEELAECMERVLLTGIDS